MQRRDFIKALGAGSALAATAGCASSGSNGSTGSVGKAKVVVIGGGYGGATAAKFIRVWSDNTIAVTLIEPNAGFVSCPLSNLVLGGSKQMADISVSYDNLQQRHGIRIVRDMVERIDVAKQTVTLASGAVLPYDRLVVSPGIDFMYDSLPGMKKAGAQDKVLHAWKAGPQTLALRKQLEAMPDGGTYVMSIPLAPYRCPPGPYERACQVAHYFSTAKPKSKVLILDANEDVTSKAALFKKVWADRYKNLIEYRPSFVATDVDADTKTIISDFGDKVQGDVLNVVPPHRAGTIAHQTGLANMNARWCEVNFLTFESTQAKNIHVLGDAIQVAPLMPKSAHMANQQAKVCAAAVVDLLNGQAPNTAAVMSNTCYSFTSDKEVIHVASVHRYDTEKKTFLSVAGAGGLSSMPNELEGTYAMNWARNIWADTLM
ncbi:MAG: FAD-dependent oxidoreductase [Herminiimonas sp.]|nr:FAD-dependent oxidoreductase [Herminiimonas sp.]